MKQNNKRMIKAELGNQEQVTQVSCIFRKYLTWVSCV